MHSQLEEYETGFRDIKNEVIALTEGVDADRLKTAPGPESWSVVEIIDHMNTSGTLLLGELEAAVEEGHADEVYGDPPFQYGFISRWWISLLQPSGWDLPAPSATEPPSPDTLPPDEIIDDFCSLQERFADCVREADGLDLRRIRAGSPALPLLRVSLGAWFEAHLGHENRHLDQMRRVLEDVEPTHA